MPVRHQAPVLLIGMREIGQIQGVVEYQRQLMEVAGQAGIDRVTPQVDDSRTWEYRMNEAQNVGVDGCLVDDVRRISDPGHFSTRK